MKREEKDMYLWRESLRRESLGAKLCGKWRDSCQRSFTRYIMKSVVRATSIFRRAILVPDRWCLKIEKWLPNLPGGNSHVEMSDVIPSPILHPAKKCPWAATNNRIFFASLLLALLRAPPLPPAIAIISFPNPIRRRLWL